MNKFTQKVTIYNDIPSDGVNPRRFDRFVIDQCLVYNTVAEGADGTVQRIVNTQNVITRDVSHYKTPIEYRELPKDLREQFYTVQIDDYVVFGEVYDVVDTAKEFQELAKKYSGNGFFVTSVNASIHYMRVDNVHIVHA